MDKNVKFAITWLTTADQKLTQIITSDWLSICMNSLNSKLNKEDLYNVWMFTVISSISATQFDNVSTINWYFGPTYDGRKELFLKNPYFNLINFLFSRKSLNK